MDKKERKDVVNFLFEAGILSKTPRSGFYFLGSGGQSVAEHNNRVVYIGYALAMLDGEVDVLKVMKMCLLHDLAEGRTSDLNYVHQKYVKSDEKRAVEDLTEELSFGDDIRQILAEYKERKSRESLLAKDADNLEWILSLKEQCDTGNAKAMDWLDSAVKRVKTKEAKKLAKEILDTGSDEWWFDKDNDDWWVKRKR